MSHPRLIEDVVAEVMAERGMAMPTCWTRRVFFRHDDYLAHEMKFVGGSAIWLAERNAVEVYDEEGRLLSTVVLEADERREAA